ncbi:MAG: hypothetical protein AAGA77_06560 [Bacteroidota bacterium]
MEKSLFLFTLLVWMCVNSYAQNNYIFNGSASDGYSFAGIDQKSNNGIFSGDLNDGFDQRYFSQSSSKWYGGVGDGFMRVYRDFQNINFIFNGSNDDGMAFLKYEQATNSQLFYGGDDDGFAFGRTYVEDVNEVYAGGRGDGFSSSGVSKLIWDGDVSKDWLMADNWNIPMVPTMKHSVCIPNGVSRYPKLSATLGISIDEVHTYASSAIFIESGAEINGIEDIKIIVNGQLIVAGDLFINAGGSERIVGRPEGLIHIFSGGSIEID